MKATSKAEYCVYCGEPVIANGIRMDKYHGAIRHWECKTWYWLPQDSKGA